MNRRTLETLRKAQANGQFMLVGDKRRSQWSITHNFPCSLGPREGHPVTICISKDGVLTSITTPCDNEIRDSVERLGGKLCISRADRFFKALEEGKDKNYNSYYKPDAVANSPWEWFYLQIIGRLEKLQDSREKAREKAERLRPSHPGDERWAWLMTRKVQEASGMPLGAEIIRNNASKLEGDAWKDRKAWDRLNSSEDVTVGTRVIFFSDRWVVGNNGEYGHPQSERSVGTLLAYRTRGTRLWIFNEEAIIESAKNWGACMASTSDKHSTLSRYASAGRRYCLACQREFRDSERHVITKRHCQKVALQVREAIKALRVPRKETRRVES